MTVFNPSHPRAEIRPLVVGQLKGRCLYFSGASAAAKKRTILMVYGQHASLERNFGIAEFLSRFGNVVAPDMPGFGAMTSFAAHRQKPTLDNFANYIGDFIDNHFKDKQKLIIVGLSFGLIVISRCLQIRPDIGRRTRLVVSLVGFAKWHSLRISRSRRRLYLIGTALVRKRTLAWVFRYLVLNRFILRRFYGKTRLARAKYAGSSGHERDLINAVEINLWQTNDTATWAATANIILKVDMTTGGRVDCRLLHIAVSSDQYFEPVQNLKDLKTVYNNVDTLEANSDRHAPTIIAPAAEIARFVPTGIGRYIRSKW